MRLNPLAPAPCRRTELADALLPSAEGREDFRVAGLRDAMADARRFPEPILIAGSLFLVGEALSLLTPGGEPLEASWQ